MDLSVGIYASLLIVFALCSGTHSSQLYLQPAKPQHGYFTGDSFFITCFTVDENIEKLTWSDFDSNRIDDTETNRIHTQPADGVQQGIRLVFTNVEKEHAGTYTCSDDQNSLSFELLIYRSVSFTDTPKEQHAAEGETAHVICNVRADQKPVVNWYYKGSQIKSSDKYKITENNNLMINNVNRSDAGVYKCKAFVITSLTSQVKDLDITLHVQYVPEIIGESEVVTYASLGSTKNLTCTVSAVPDPMFQWLRDDMIIHHGREGYIIFNATNSSVLQLTVDDEDQLGKYICRASNPLGQQEVTIELKKGETPNSPKLSVISEDQGVLKLNIEPQDDPDSDEEFKVTGYKVEYILATDSWDMPNSQEFAIGEPYLLKNMSFNSDYLLRAAASNVVGYGEFSEPMAYKTHSLQVASVIASASGMVPSLLVLAISIVFFRLF